jgi:hypothetical protein
MVTLTTRFRLAVAPPGLRKTYRLSSRADTKAAPGMLRDPSTPKEPTPL